MNVCWHFKYSNPHSLFICCIQPFESQLAKYTINNKIIEMVVYTIDTPPNEGVLFEEPNTVLKLNTNTVGDGILYLSESALSWFNSSQNRGLSVPWRNVIIHAKTPEPESSIYIQIDSVYEWRNGTNQLNHSNGDQEESDDEEMDMTELWFIPERKESLGTLYTVMTTCQAMNPDPDDEQLDEDEDVDEWDENGSGDMRNLSIRECEEGQFDDAE